VSNEDVEAFVNAADRLVNLLNTTPSASRGWHGRHRIQVDEAMNAYDEARAALMGDPHDTEDDGEPDPL